MGKSFFFHRVDLKVAVPRISIHLGIVTALVSGESLQAQVSHRLVNDEKTHDPVASAYCAAAVWVGTDVSDLAPVAHPAARQTWRSS